MPAFHHKLDRLMDRFMPDGVKVDDLKTERLWVLIIFCAAFFSSLFVLLDFFIIVGPASTLCASIALACPIYLWLFNKGFRAGSKLSLHAHVLLILFIITILYSDEGYAWTFLIPVLISTQLVFTPRQRPYAAVIIALCFAFLPIYFAIHTHFPPLGFDEVSMRTFKIMNLSGSMAFCVLILSTIVRMNNNTQRQLQREIIENEKQNKIMLGSMRTRDKLLSMMSHDIRGDIGKTIGVVDVIEQMDLGKEEQSTLLNNLKIDAEKTLETLDNMLQWTRTQQDELNLKSERYEVDRLISRQLSNNDYALNIKRQLVHLNIPEKLVLMVDHNMIDSVFRNLISNAIKFTPIEGVISITAKKEDAHILFEIQDSGVGMSEEQMFNILKGVQFTTRGTNREKGRGFGMVLVTEFLAKHKSILQIESTPGKGTRFSFRLPTPTSA